MISLIFHHLVDKDFFTDEIGERLLKLFPTGSTMATRRPTTVHLSSQMDSDNCRVRLELGNQSAEFSNIDQFDALLDAMDAQSRAKNNSAFMEEVVISIYAKTLPNVSFTDLTGSHLLASLYSQQYIFLPSQAFVQSTSPSVMRKQPPSRVLYANT
jgi:hypothetical protein